MLVFSDVHLNEDSADTVLGQVLPGIHAAAQEHNQRELVCLGDFWDIRYRVDVRLFNAVREVFHKWTNEGLHLRILPGNHDQVDLQGRNALEAYGDIPGVDVYTNPCWDKDGFWLPYRKSTADLRASLAWAWDNHYSNEPATLFAHFGLVGALMNDQFANTDGLGVDELNRWVAVLCGHYHKRQSLGRGTFIGSPYQTSAGESGQKKGYALWDNGRLQFVDTIWGKRYHRFDVNPGEEPDLSDVREGDDVRIKVLGEGAEARAATLGSTLGDVNAVVTPEVVPMRARLEVVNNATTATYAKAFVEAIETPLDKKRLMKAFEYVTGVSS